MAQFTGLRGAQNVGNAALSKLFSVCNAFPVWSQNFSVESHISKRIWKPAKFSSSHSR